MAGMTRIDNFGLSLPFRLCAAKSYWKQVQCSQFLLLRACYAAAATIAVALASISAATVALSGCCCGVRSTVLKNENSRAKVPAKSKDQSGWCNAEVFLSVDF